MKKYRSIGMGGTFDHFHVGHQFFLNFAAALSDHLQVGITKPALTKHKTLSELIEPFELREQNVQNFLKQKNISGTTFTLENIFGPTLENSQVEALAVTEHTVKGAEAINAERKKRGLAELPVHVCEVIKDAHGNFISSTRIRLGEISRSGEIYRSVFEKEFSLNEKQRQFFGQKQGVVVEKPKSMEFKKYVVGDVVLDTFLANGWQFELGIFDKKSQRTEHISVYQDRLQDTTKVSNPAGIFSHDLIEKLQDCIDSNQKLLFVNGEEDLAAVALVLLLPLDTAVYYGQPHEGMIEMIVTEELKTRFYNILGNSD